MKRDPIGTREYLPVVKPHFAFSTAEFIKPMAIWGVLTYGSLALLMFLDYRTPAFWFCLAVHGLSVVNGLSFFHTAVHLRHRKPLIEKIYNLLFGYYFSYPSYISYPHLSRHHNKRYYATEGDTRYLPLVFYRNNLVAMISMCVSVPIIEIGAVLVRMVFAPLYVIMPLAVIRRILDGIHAKDGFTPQIKPDVSADRSQAGIMKDDLISASIQWSMLILVLAGVLPLKFLFIYLFALWYFHLDLVIKTAVEHRFEEYLGETERHISMLEFRNLELSDSLTIEQRGIWRLPRMIFISDATCYHCLHHWFPKIPDVHLHAAHKALLQVLPEEHPYRASIQRGFFSALTGMLFKAPGAATEREADRSREVETGTQHASAPPALRPSTELHKASGLKTGISSPAPRRFGE